jgi:hypothetical protein
MASLLQSFKVQLVNVAPAPFLARLERLDDGMPARAEVFRRVLVPRAVAAADVTAREAQPQVNPSVARLQTFLTALRARRHFANLIQVLASHSSSLVEKNKTRKMR